jgi:hypothetical protein
MTRELIGKALISSPIVDNTIMRLTECEGLEPILVKKKPAHIVTGGNAYIEMVALARSHLFVDTQMSIDRDAIHFYHLTRTAAEQDDSTLGKVYQGICLLRGVGVDSDWNEGFELLADVASKETHCDGKDLALYTLGMCYMRGAFGFKRNEVKGRKWLDRVEAVPSFVSDYWDEHVEEENPGDVLLFDVIQANPNYYLAQSSASTMTSLTTALTEGRCTECGENTNDSDLIGQRCLGCAGKEIDRLFSFNS